MLFDNSVKRIVCVLLVVVMIGAALGFLIFANRRESREREVLVMQYESEKRICDQKINDLNKQLRQKKDEIFGRIPSLSSAFCLGVKASSAEELADILQVVEPFGYPITVILDAELSSETIERMLGIVWQKDGFCVIPCGSEEAMLRLMEAEGDIICPLAYLDGRASEEMKESLAEKGFVGYSEALGSDAKTVSTAIYADSIGMMAHIPIGENNALNSAAGDAAGRGVGMFLTVEMENIGKTFNKGTVIRVIERIGENYISAGDMKPYTIADYLDDARQYAIDREKAEAELAVYEAENKEQVAELEAEIDRIAEKYRWW